MKAPAAAPPPAPSAAAPRPLRAAAPRSARRGEWLKLLRRAHLYSGLALLPWVALYGATALLFNHSDWFTGRESSAIDAARASAVAGALPDADQLAQQVVASLEQALAREGESLALDPHVAPSWAGALIVEGRTAEDSLRLAIDSAGRGGRSTREPRESDEPTALERLERVAVADVPSEPLLAAARELAPPDLEGELRVARLPSLTLGLVDGSGRRYRCNADVSRGRVQVRAVAEEGTLDTREFLLRLHMAHGSPGFRDARWAWSWIVDAMGIAMLVWGASGAVMWWAIRPTRQIGAWIVGASLIAAALLAAGMWNSFTA